MPFMAMSDSITRSTRYPVQSAHMAGMGDDPSVEQFQEGYKTYVNQWLPYLIKKKAPAEIIKLVKEEIKNKRWQRAHDALQLYFENQKNPMLPYLFKQIGPVAGAPKAFGIAEHKSCCSGCASGAPCCGHDHALGDMNRDDVKIMLIAIAGPALLVGLIGGAIFGKTGFFAGAVAGPFLAKFALNNAHRVTGN